MDEVFYKGEIGRIISQTTHFDWTGATAKQVKIRRPDGTTVTKTGVDVVVDDAKTGQIHILTATGDLDQTGEYFLQAKLQTASVTLFGSLTSFQVEDVLA